MSIWIFIFNKNTTGFHKIDFRALSNLEHRVSYCDLYNTVIL